MDNLISQLKEFQQFKNEMNETTSNNVKLDVIKKWSNNSFIIRIFKYTYNHYKKYGIHKKVLLKHSDLINLNIFNYDDLFKLLDDLANNTLTGHNAIIAVNNFLSKLPKEYHDIIYSILNRDLVIGASITSILKIIPDLIPTFNVALANVYSPNRVDFYNESWYASRKMDGCLNENTVIEFDDGKKLKIKDVVNFRIKGNIKSYNIRTKKIEYKPILDWMVNLEDINQDNTDWFEIELENNKKIILTGNHRVWLPDLNCWRRTDELNGNEKIFIC